MAMMILPKRARLLAGCAMAAAMAGQAHAQTVAYGDRALQGDIVGNPAGVSINRSSQSDTITISGPQAIINWNPETGQGTLPAGPITFLHGGSAANFRSAAADQNFTVLNRILPSDPTRAISINGIVNSAIKDSDGNFNQGGSVWFYSPGGIIVGSTAVFNVGNLVLTASDIDASQGLIDAGGTIRFRGAAGSTSLIDIRPGASINALAGGSYMAVVAPRVNNEGRVRTDGSVAYIAAQSVDVKINGGLFDINFVSGTDASGQVLSHTGQTIAATNGDYSSKATFLAAMPKNQAISMLLGGVTGYTPAAAAGYDNGTVVLSAGLNVAGGSAVVDYNAPKLASITIGQADATSSVRATATGKITLQPGAGTSANFAGGLALFGGDDLLVNLDGASLSVGGDLSIGAFDRPVGGNATLSVSNSGSVGVGGNLSINADSSSQSVARIAESTKGGNAKLTIGSGGVLSTGTLSVTANATSRYAEDAGGSAVGGKVTVSVADSPAGSSLTAGDTSLLANGVGSEAGYGLGGAGTGGTIEFTATNAQLELGATFLRANGTGAAGNYTGNSGAAAGGTINLSVRNSLATLNVLELSADGRSNDAFGQGDGGSAAGGRVTATFDATVLNSPFTATTRSFGGTAYGGNGGNASDNGGISLSLMNGTTLNGDLSLTTYALGGDTSWSYDFNEDGVAEIFGVAGTARAGNITLNVAGATVNAPNSVSLLASAQGGNGPVAGSATGGQIQIDFAGGEIATSASSTFSASADAIGGRTNQYSYSTPVLSARGGNATGGTITLNQGTSEEAAGLAFGALSFSATAKASEIGYGDVGSQGLIQGGVINANLTNGSITTTDNVTFDVSALGSRARSIPGTDPASAGNATGGMISLNLRGVAIDAKGIELRSTGQGGAGENFIYGEGSDDQLAAIGGSGTGGTIALTATGGSINGDVLVDASGRGGAGGSGDKSTDGAAGGNATGGLITVGFGEGSVLNGGVTLRGGALGGAGGGSYTCFFGCERPSPAGGRGGDAVARGVSFTFSGESSTLGLIDLVATATGGAGGTVENYYGIFGSEPRTAGAGGNAIGGASNIGLLGSANSFGDIRMAANAEGGAGGYGEIGGIGGLPSAAILPCRLAMLR